MEIKIVPGDISKIQSQVIILNHFEDSEVLEEETTAVDKVLGGLVSQLVKQREIKGKFKEITTVYASEKNPCSKIVVLGLGKKADLTPEKIRVATAEVCKALRQRCPDAINAAPFGLSNHTLAPEIVGQAMAEGALLGSYKFSRHMEKNADSKEVSQLNIIVSNKKLIEPLTKGCIKGQIIAEATNFVRDLGNEPGNVLTPTAMATAASQIAYKYNLNIKIIDQDEMRLLKMGGLLGVAQGSMQPPKFIVLNYKGKSTDDLDIALVGKGITFDSGGISIKPSENMGEMKGDMAGGAAVMGAISAIAQLKPEINVAAIIPATENLPSGNALKPGDIIAIMNGKTVEIISTDAEGRLILADALSYAIKIGAHTIVDVATLTGACHIALGDVCTGVFSNNQELADKIIAAGKESGECMWQMPMNEEYRELNKSSVADIKNTGGRYAGAITAAWFLREFVESTPWVHMDIAGTSTIDKDRGYQIKGNTGIPVRTLIDLVLNLSEKPKTK